MNNGITKTIIIFFIFMTIILSGCASNKNNIDDFKSESVQNDISSEMASSDTTLSPAGIASKKTSVSLLRVDCVESEYLTQYDLLDALDEGVFSGISLGIGNDGYECEPEQSGGGYAVYDLSEEEYDMLSFSLVHIPCTDNLPCTYDFFYNGELAYSITVGTNQPLSTYTIPVRGVEELKIVGGDYAGRWAIVNPYLTYRNT